MSISEVTPQIIYEDTHLLVLSKPAGLLSQGEHTGDPNLVDWCKKHFERNYVGLVHRLDRNVSGIIVVAKRSKSAQRLTLALQNGELRRTYLAWVEGHLEKPERWEHFLFKDQKKNITTVVPGSHPEAKKAVLHIQPIVKKIYQNQPISLVEIELETGRSHQIRVQSAYEKHSVLGDVKYGKSKIHLQRPALHSFRLIFPHPMSKKTPKEIFKFEAPLPAEINSF